MIQEQDILFVTTTLYSKWLTYSSKLIKNSFPESEHLIIDGTKNWPYAWFYWLDKVKNKNQKWLVLLDEDCFLMNKQELLSLIEKMEKEDISISAVSDGYHHYRGANPVAINAFFMVANLKDINDLSIDINNIKFWHETGGWRNSLGYIYKNIYREDFDYQHRIMAGEKTEYEQEPYYMIFWMLKEKRKKFYYLFPHFDEFYKSTNPRITESSPDIVIHMWYTRQWNTDMDVWGLPNYERYKRIEDKLLSM